MEAGDRAIQAWRAVNLKALQVDLDQQSADIVKAQQDGIENRKRLAQQTRDFKKVPDDEKVGNFRPLLKAYQVEIDAVTQRCKAVEAAFLDVYQKLGNAPDPVSMISVVQEHDAATVAQAQQRIAELEARHQQLLQQQQQSRATDEVVQSLKQRLATYESKLEVMVQDAVTQREKELAAAAEERAQILKANERELTRELDQHKAALLQMQQRQSQLEDELIKAQQHQQTAGGPLDAAHAAGQQDASDISLMQLSLDAAHAEIAKLQTELAQQALAKSVEVETDPTAEQSALSGEAVAQQLQTRLDEQAAAFEQQMAAMQQHVAATEQQCAVLAATVAQQADYAAIKDELQVFRRVALGEADDAAAGADHEHDLATRLLAKSKRLENDLAQTRVQIMQMQDALTTRETDAAQAAETLAQQTARITQLERELAAYEALSASPAMVPAAAGHVAARRKLSTPNKPPTNHAEVIMSLLGSPGSDDMDDMDPLAPSVAAAATAATPDVMSPPQPQGSMHATPPATAPSSMVPMLIQQRDRYKQQCTALNQRVQDLVSSEADIRRQLTQLQEDNHGLFAKLKYAQSFSEGRARHGEAAGDVALQIHASSTSYDAAPSHSRGGGGKYQDFYEERLDPFSRFRQREKTRRIAQMHPIEKVMYGAANLMLRSRHMRMAVVVYVGLLHCLVFATLYRVGWNSHDLVSENPLPEPGVLGDSMVQHP